jgi:hypothetical protein
MGVGMKSRTKNAERHDRHESAAATERLRTRG